MVGVIIEIKEIDDRTKEINAALKAIKELEVLVGIPQDEDSRSGDISNAELAYIHTHGTRAKSMINDMDENMSQGASYGKAYKLYIASKGSPIHSIPPRPIIEPAIEDKKEQLAGILKEPVKKALDGNKDGAIESLNKAGMQGQNIVRAWFTNPKNNWPKLSERTIEARRRQGKNVSSVKPLIDTGELRKSITYIVRKKG